MNKITDHKPVREKNPDIMKRKKRLIVLLLVCVFGLAAVFGAAADEPKTIEGPAERSVSDVTAYLDVRKESEGVRYLLLVNGEPLEWEQSIEDAVRFCQENGLAIDCFSNGNGVSGEQKIVFGGDIPLCDASSFYLDQGAGPAEGKLNSVRMYTEITLETADEAAEKAQWLYEKLRAYLGKTPEIVHVYTGGDDAEKLPLSEYNVSEAVKRMMKNRQGEFAFVVVQFDNLDLEVQPWEDYISVMIRLTIF